MTSDNKKHWSQQVTESSHALDLEPGLFTVDDPKKIANSLKKAADQSERKKTTSFRSAMSMLTFYINRAGSQLSKDRFEILEQAKEELRQIYGRQD